MLAPEGSEQQIFASAFDFAQGQLLYRRSPGRFLAFSANRKFDKACKIVHDFADKFVHNALAHRKSEYAQNRTSARYVFLDELAKVTNDPRQLRDELLNILLAGRDTTASLLSNTFHVLAWRPNIWNRLKAEVDELNGEKPDYETLRNMKYVKYLLNECELIKLQLFTSRERALTPPSPPPLPRRPDQLPLRQQIDPPPPRRRPPRGLPHPHSRGPRRLLFRIRHAPPARHLRPRRRRVQTRALGNIARRVELSPLQRRAADLCGAAVRADGGRVCDCEAMSGVWGVGREGWGCVEGAVWTYNGEFGGGEGGAECEVDGVEGAWISNDF